VHSWSHNRSPGRLTDNLADATVGPDVYSRVRKLPGRPLWQKLNDPVCLLLYLERHGIQKVMRWRVLESRPRVYTLGSILEYHFEKPGELPPGYLDEICLMVEAGGSVNTEFVRSNLERAFLIAYVVENGVIVGNSSLKHPRPAYIKTVNQQSGLDLTHYVERGYTSVRPEYRGLGIGVRLLEGLTKRAGSRKVFSVISEDNAAARKMAIRNRTRQVAEYYSQRLGKRVGVWIPEWML
jgi:GNAT superfamily N-acetyltransferase